MRVGIGNAKPDLEIVDFQVWIPERKRPKRRENVGIGNANPVKKSKIFELEAGAEAERSYPITERDKKWKIIFLIKSMKLT